MMKEVDFGLLRFCEQLFYGGGENECTFEIHREGPCLFFRTGLHNPISMVPFTALKKPLSDCCVTIVTTSFVEEKSEENISKESEIVLMGDVYEIDSHLKASELFSRHEGYDSYATNLDDVDSFFPTTNLHASVAEGRVGSVAPFYYNAFSTYSKKRTEQIDGPAVLKGCREHKVDAAIVTGI
jgi:D-proline reductase (dithiol) PrdB